MPNVDVSLSLTCRVRQRETCPEGLGRGKLATQGWGGERCPSGLGRGKHVLQG